MPQLGVVFFAFDIVGSDLVDRALDAERASAEDARPTRWDVEVTATARPLTVAMPLDQKLVAMLVRREAARGAVGRRTQVP